MTFADLLKKAIDKNGLSVAKVAADSGLSRETVYAILRGTTPNPGWETIRDLLKALPKTKPKEFFPRERTRSTAHKGSCA